VRELGVFCGTFNPIHWGHLLLAECARDQFELEKLVLVTSPIPPHKADQDLLSAANRHRLVVAACEGNKAFEPSTLELDRQGPSYTVDTLRELKKQYGDGVRLNLIIGEDNLASIGQWHEAKELFRLCRLLVAPRQDSNHGSPSRGAADSKDLCPDGATMSMIDFPGAGVSSSEIRARLRRGQSVLYFVPPAVNKLLMENKYYLDEVSGNSR
jgi:nicotinate-nucleotide adenylyltransferase